MKFVFLLEENGYEFRYWDEDTSEIGETLTSNWNIGEFHETLKLMGFQIKKQELTKACELLKKKTFVLFSSHSGSDVDTLYYDWFEVDA
jgi:hypothetical protein